jgi:hypothetical protein
MPTACALIDLERIRNHRPETDPYRWTVITGLCPVEDAEGLAATDAVSRVVNPSATSRRSMTETFYRPSSMSTMWPPVGQTPLHHCQAADLR